MKPGRPLRNSASQSGPHPFSPLGAGLQGSPGRPPVQWSRTHPPLWGQARGPGEGHAHALPLRTGSGVWKPQTYPLWAKAGVRRHRSPPSSGAGSGSGRAPTVSLCGAGHRGHQESTPTLSPLRGPGLGVPETTSGRVARAALLPSAGPGSGPRGARGSRSAARPGC